MQNVMVLFGRLSFESNISNEVVIIVDSQSIVELTDHRFIGNQFNILSKNSIYRLCYPELWKHNCNFKFSTISLVIANKHWSQTGLSTYWYAVDYKHC